MKRTILLLTIFMLFIALAACSNTDEPDEELQEEAGWEVSPSFQLGDYPVRGEEGKLAILDLPFISKEVENYIIYLWRSEENDLNGQIRIEAVHETTGDIEKAVILYAGTDDEEKTWEAPIPRISGQQAYLSVDLSLPYEGLWRLDIFVDGEKFGDVIVEVERN